jgi:hypothetical protein
MAIFQKRVTFYRCEKCGYEWPQRFRDTPPPTVCANRRCKATTWNKPRPKRAKR